MTKGLFFVSVNMRRSTMNRSFPARFFLLVLLATGVFGCTRTISTELADHKCYLYDIRLDPEEKFRPGESILILPEQLDWFRSQMETWKKDQQRAADLALEEVSQEISKIEGSINRKEDERRRLYDPVERLAMAKSRYLSAQSNLDDMRKRFGRTPWEGDFLRNVNSTKKTLGELESTLANDKVLYQQSLQRYQKESGELRTELPPAMARKKKAGLTAKAVEDRYWSILSQVHVIERPYWLWDIRFCD